MKKSLITIVMSFSCVIFCSEESTQEQFIFKGWLLKQDFFGNLKEIELQKKEVDNDYTIIQKSYNSFAYRRRRINPRAIAFTEKLHERVEDDEK